MDAAEMTQFPKPESKSESRLMDSKCVRVTIPQSLEISTQNVNKNMENDGEARMRVLKIPREIRGRNWNWKRNWKCWYFAVVCLCVLMFSGVCLGVYICQSSHDLAGSASPPTLSAPRFFVDEHFKGPWFSPRPGWENKCIEMPPHMNNKASSVKLGGHCLLICSTTNCENPPYYYQKKCIEIHPDYFGLDDFKKLEYNDEIGSFRLCKDK